MDAQTAAAAANLGAQIANNAGAIAVNTKNRKWAKKMYEQQRADNISDWHMQNAYNTPAAQMQRLKEAGLNPHLVYGNGADATSGSLPKEAQMEYVAQPAPQFDANSVLGSYFDTQVKQATIDNLKVQKTVQEQEAILKSVQALQAMASTDKTKEETTNIQMLRETTIEAARKNIEKLSADIASTKANTVYTLNENMRKQQLQPITIRTMNEQIKNMIEQRKLTQEQTSEVIQRIDNMITEGELKTLELNLRKQGVNPNDPAWQRELMKLLNDMFGPDKPKNWKLPDMVHPFLK